MGVGVTIQGFGGTVAEVSGTTFRALRVSPRPIDYGSLGAYRKSLISGSITAGLAANSEVLQWRWTSTAGLGVVTRVQLDGAANTTGFAAGNPLVVLRAARGWTADGSGGTAGTITGNNGKLRTTGMGTTLLGAMRIISTVALGTGTKTLDTDPIGGWTGTVGTGANLIMVGQHLLFGDDAYRGAQPFVAIANEGLVAQASVPATGVWQVGFTVAWTEVTSY